MVVRFRDPGIRDNKALDEADSELATAMREEMIIIPKHRKGADVIVNGKKANEITKACKLWASRYPREERMILEFGIAVNIRGVIRFAANAILNEEYPDQSDEELALNALRKLDDTNPRQPKKTK